MGKRNSFVDFVTFSKKKLIKNDCCWEGKGHIMPVNVRFETKNISSPNAHKMYVQQKNLDVITNHYGKCPFTGL